MTLQPTYSAGKLEAIARKELGLTERAVQELSLLKDEPSWARERRLEAWRLYEQLPMPSPSDEVWRRTDLNPVPFHTVAPFSEPHDRVDILDKLPKEILAGLNGTAEQGGLTVQQDSHAVYASLSNELAAKGVIFTDLDRAVKDYPELCQQYFMQGCIPARENKFTALHGALWSGGVLLYVPKDVQVALPLNCLLYLAEPEVAVFPHTLIIADQGSSVTLVDDLLSAPQQGLALSIPLVEIFVGDGAKVNYVAIQEWRSNVYTLGIQRTIVGRDAAFQSVNIGLGGRLSKWHTGSRLVGAGGRSDLVGILLAQNREHFDHDTLQHHLAPHTTSDLLVKSVLKDRARYIYYGLIKIAKEAQQSQGFQTDRNLLLSGRAKADSIPVLEIEADDVRCSHASATGQVDEEQLFYLMSRGIPRLEAERTLIEGFFEPVLSRVPVGALKERIWATVREKIRT
ncbi:MAG: Fe-S cluster assembly protein SufD [Chloroflexi bacterium]|nr:Fe-S cluster assembly protein SufD [Chloroflexota bacterium]